MRVWIFIFLFIQLACKNDIKQPFQLQKGDLLFQDLDSSPLANAIEKVTPGYKKASLSHIGIVAKLGDPFCINPSYIYEDDVRIIEAIPNGVQMIRLDSFLNRSFDINNNPKVIVGRLKPKYQYAIESAIYFLENKLGEKYDEAFLINNDSYYCSELIYEAFKESNIFHLKPMTFLDPETNETMKIWEEYYSKLNLDVPQNMPGINPGTMSLSNKIDIIYLYGNPDNITVK